MIWTEFDGDFCTGSDARGWAVVRRTFMGYISYRMCHPVRYYFTSARKAKRAAEQQR